MDRAGGVVGGHIFRQSATISVKRQKVTQAVGNRRRPRLAASEPKKVQQ